MVTSFLIVLFSLNIILPLLFKNPNIFPLFLMFKDVQTGSTVIILAETATLKQFLIKFLDLG